MSSKFVSGGTNDAPIERDEAWIKAQEEIEAARQRKLAEGQQASGKSLYEVLQANKAAKQDAFEESIRLKNQFRSLDDDEIDFLDKVLESTRAREAAVRKETAEQVDAFRKQQEDAEKAALEGPGDNEGAMTAGAGEQQERWVAGRKRRKGKEAEGVLRGLKLRKTSSAGAEKEVVGAGSSKSDAAKGKEKVVDRSESSKEPSAPDKPPLEASAATKPPPAKIVGLGLGDYSSDED